ncbi:hypothetical protein [Aquimarina mytili]|uniref:Uncharacterized protein n=1 Tax=Aquimarina mytili TaxID=874423 RepID=A0A936ZV05_9FLAO|nr:hypothetical protein [Aquimarina mytili]MBL0686099.1 hypothetical protein [Aquimarina mytili]
MHPEDKEKWDQFKKNVSEGKDPVTEAFKLGFMACLQSVEDKGHTELVKLLKYEYTLIDKNF